MTFTIYTGDTIEVQYQNYILSGFYTNRYFKCLILSKNLCGNKEYTSGIDLNIFGFNLKRVVELKFKNKKVVLTEKAHPYLKNYRHVTTINSFDTFVVY